MALEGEVRCPSYRRENSRGHSAPPFRSRHRVFLQMEEPIERNTDWIYKAVSVPWMFTYGLTIEDSGKAFATLLDEVHPLVDAEKDEHHE